MKDEFLEYFAKNPSYEEAYLKFGDKLLEYELLGKIKRINQIVDALPWKLQIV